MKTISKDVKREVFETVTIYVAKDGKEFQHKWDCQKHEAILNLVEVRKKYGIPDLRGEPIFDSGEHLDCHNYEWFYVKDDEAVKEINEAMCANMGCYRPLKHSDVGKHICIEYTEDYSDTWWSSAEDAIAYVETIMKICGYKIIVKKGGD